MATRKELSEAQLRGLAIGWQKPSFRDENGKTCGKCKKHLSLDNFHKMKSNIDGLQTQCIQCQHERRKYRYISKERFQELQSLGCEICGSFDWDARHGEPHQDHNHASGKFRGLLCGYCNLMLGQSRDSIEILEKAIEYLKRHMGELE